MIIPGSNYWNVGLGRNIGDVKEDEEGMQTMQVLGENMVAVEEDCGVEGSVNMGLYSRVNACGASS